MEFLDNQYENYYRFRSSFEKYAIDSGDLICKYIADEVNSYDDIFDKLLQFFATLYESGIELSVMGLIRMGIDCIDRDRFLQMHCAYYDMEKSLDCICYLDSQMTNFLESVTKMKFQKKKSSTKWVGGGIGVSGAITGVLIASTLNLGNSAMNSVGNAITSNVQRNRIRRQIEKVKDAAFKEFYPAVVKSVWQAIRDAIFTMFDCCYDILSEEEKICHVVFDGDKTIGRAKNIKMMYQNNLLDKNQAVSRLLECKKEYPYHLWIDWYLTEIEPQIRSDIEKIDEYLGFGKDFKRCYSRFGEKGEWSCFPYEYFDGRIN